MSESIQSSTSEYASDTTGTSESSSSKETRSVEDDETNNDKGFSAIDLECHIQTERITKCLNKLVYQTKLAVSIPILKQKNILARVLTEDDFHDVCFIIDSFGCALSSTSFMSVVEGVEMGDVSLKNRAKPDLSIMMYTLCRYPALEPHVERIIEKMKRDYFCYSLNTPEQPSCLVHSNPVHSNHDHKKWAGVRHLQTLEQFRDLMVERMKTTAAEEISAVIHTRKTDLMNSEHVAQIKENTRCLAEEKEIHDKEMAQKMKLISDLKEELAVSNYKSGIKMRKQILDSERQMVLATRSHKVKYQMLKEEEIESKELYGHTLFNNINTEKLLRDRRRKVETQLQSWLQKYDLEMSDKQAEIDETTRGYDEEIQKIEELQLKLEEQDKEFYPIKEEKEKEYHQEMTAKLDSFIIEHAARVIQYAWRQTLENRAEKKKLVKLKKKMEAEKEAAAKKAELEARKAAAEARKRAAREKAEAKEAAKQAKLEARAAKAQADAEKAKK